MCDLKVLRLCAGDVPSDAEVERLLQDVEKYTLASHLFWGLWGIISVCTSMLALIISRTLSLAGGNGCASETKHGPFLMWKPLYWHGKTRVLTVDVCFRSSFNMHAALFFLITTISRPSSLLLQEHVNEINFDYMGYARQRFEQYWSTRPILLSSHGTSPSDGVTDGWTYPWVLKFVNFVCEYCIYKTM